ncbi:MAG: 50S ribosomal protein L6 [Saprospiraceae bacterium]|jgi:large subunit ribosomal protein L6|nr:50S ribosomal protein L6 [Saprospiraceae bacterium]
MSRIGKMPISIPAGVSISVENNVVRVKGPKGSLHQVVDKDIEVVVEDNQVVVNRPTDQKRHRAMHGLYRSLVFNMVQGVSDGFTKQLELVGVGYRCSSTGQLLELALGYSHPVMFYVPEEVVLATKMEKGSNPTVILQSSDKQLLGQVAAKIRAFRKPEPYKGKGVRYTGEIIRRKAGKAGAKKK